MTDSKKEVHQRVAKISDLFSTADLYDCILMIIGAIGSIVTGACLPCFCILFGKIIDTLNVDNSSENKLENVIDLVNLLFLIIIFGDIL